MPRSIQNIKPAGKTRTWIVYILRCRGGRLYTGITNNLARRVAVHQAGQGARFTRAFAPVSLAWSAAGYTRSGAAVREAAIKRLPRQAKQKLLPRSKPQLSKK